MRGGFTLIEVIIVISIFSIVIGIMSGFFYYFYKNQAFLFDYSDIVDQAQRGVEVMAKEIREAKIGEDGSYPIVYAGDKQFIFNADIDNDGVVERVRYFVGDVVNDTITKTCSTSVRGGSCSVSFSDFFNGNLTNAELSVSVKGDFGFPNWERADVSADGNALGSVCSSGCVDCSSSYEGLRKFNVLEYASDNNLSAVADASAFVDPICSGQSMDAKFDLSFSYEDTSADNILKKGVIEPSGDPPVYLSSNETISVISNYITNTPPIFQYYDKQGNLITDTPAKLKDTRLMRVYLIVDNDPSKDPKPFELETYINIRSINESL